MYKYNYNLFIRDKLEDNILFVWNKATGLF